MKSLIIILSIIIPSVISAQDFEVTIEADRNEYSRTDSIELTYRIKNTGTKSAVLKTMEGFMLKNRNNTGGNSLHCFTLHPASHPVNKNGMTKDEFVEINPGEEITVSDYYNIGWLCRNAPPRGNMEFEISYERTVNAEDNYYLFESHYTGNYEKIFVDAWTGRLKSNNIKISVVE